MKKMLILLFVTLFLGSVADTFGAYYRGGTYNVYIEGDDAAVDRTRYTYNKSNNVYVTARDGRIMPKKLTQKPQWYTVVPANGGTVDVFYVEAGQRKHMRARADLWQDYGWDCRYNIGEQGSVQFAGKRWN